MNVLTQVINQEVSFEDNLNLTKLVTNFEIKEAIFEIRDEKSPGPDEIPACFYKKY